MSTTNAGKAHGGGQVIRAWRRRRKLTQKELAARTGYTPRDIRALERGEVALAARAIKKISAALAVESRDLEQEIAWRGSQEEPEPVGDASDPEELTIEELSTSWDVISNYLKPWFLKLAEWTLRKEAESKRPKGSKP